MRISELFEGSMTLVGARGLPLYAVLADEDEAAASIGILEQREICVNGYTTTIVGFQTCVYRTTKFHLVFASAKDKQFTPFGPIKQFHEKYSGAASLVRLMTAVVLHPLLTCLCTFRVRQ